LKIGNFGTGYSNLSYLTQLPVSSLKIDRSFVSTIGDGTAKCDLVRAVATLARNLGLKVVAEGVTSGEQLEELRSLSCDSAQGSYFSEPMDLDLLREFIDENENRKLPPPDFIDVTVLPNVQ